MLWYKSWLETRWRFLVGLLLLMSFSAMLVATEPLLANMQVDVPDLGERLNELVRETMAIAKTYPGYVWSQWFGKNLISTWPIFAVLLGAGGVVTETARGTALFTLSLPVTRRRLLAVRALVGGLELLILAVVPSLLIPLLSLAIGKTYPIGAALLYSLLTVLGGMVFFSFSFLLSSVFTDQLKPIVIGVGVSFLLNMLPVFHSVFERYSVYAVMSGRSYFLTGAFPWVGLIVCLALAAAMFLLSMRILERRDF
jgi:ABC-2 type transport system permease protein